MTRHTVSVHSGDATPPRKMVCSLPNFINFWFVPWLHPDCAEVQRSRDMSTCMFSRISLHLVIKYQFWTKVAYTRYLTVFITVSKVDAVYNWLSLFGNNVGIWTTRKMQLLQSDSLSVVITDWLVLDVVRLSKEASILSLADVVVIADSSHYIKL